MRTQLANWLVRIGEFRNSLKRQEEPPIEEFKALQKDFAAFAHDNFDATQIQLLDSDAGVTRGLGYAAYKGDAKSLWLILSRWEFRLTTYIQDLN